MTIKESCMSAVSSGLTIDELEAQAGEFLPAREEMTVTIKGNARLSAFGRRSGFTIADGDVVFGDIIITNIKKG